MPAARTTSDEVAYFKQLSLLDIMFSCQLHCILLPMQSSKLTPQTIHIRGPTIEMDEGSQGPGTKGEKSGTVEAYELDPSKK